MTRPLETARVLAPKLLPLEWRWRLLGLLGRERAAGVDVAAQVESWQQELDGELASPRRPALVHLPPAGDAPRVSVLIVAHGNAAMTRLCLTSLRAWTGYSNLEILVVDNGSTDGTAAMLEEVRSSLEPLRVISSGENVGFAAACNRAAREADGEVLCFLNNDTVVTPGWLSLLVGALRREPRLGMVGPVSNGVANEARVPGRYETALDLCRFAEERGRRHDGHSFAIPMLALYCAAIRRDVWDEVGELDERFGVGMFEDDDYCRRLRAAGYSLRCLEDAFVHHWQQASFARLDRERYAELYRRNRAYLRQKWGR